MYRLVNIAVRRKKMFFDSSLLAMIQACGAPRNKASWISGIIIFYYTMKYSSEIMQYMSYSRSSLKPTKLGSPIYVRNEI